MQELRNHMRIRTGRILSGALLGMLVVAGFPANAWAARIYVNARSTAANPDGTTWATAYTSAQEAVFLARPGDEVWVAAGLYLERVTLKANTGFYGGFQGDETERTGRDIRANATILDSEGMGRVVTVPSTATGCTIEGFTIRNGTTQNEGGGIYAATNVTIQNNVLANNLAMSGGGIYAWGGTIRDNVLIGNRATEGGGLFIYTLATVRNNIFRGNQAGRGGGIRVGWGGRIEGNLIDANSASDGGGVWSQSYDFTLANNTLVNNAATRGGAVAVDQHGFPVTANNIVAHNSSGFWCYSSGTAIRNNCFFGNGADFTSANSFPDQVGQKGNVRADPLFVDSPHGDYHLRPESPCRNTGDNSVVTAGATDLDGEPRIQEFTVDMGADESDGAPRESRARIVRVRPDGSDAKDGATWENARRTVQAAVDAAAATGGEVWLAPGVYAGPVTMPAYVGLYGGFTGAETTRDERAFTGVATLDGLQAGTTVTIPRASVRVMVDGVTVRGGRAPAGGGIACTAVGAEITRNTVVGNVSTSATEGGGGLYFLGVTPVIRDNVIRDNTAANRGGGLYASGAYLRVTNNTFVDNGAPRGGAMAFADYSIVLVNNIVAENTSAIYYPYEYAYDTTIRNNCFYNNGASPFQGLTEDTGISGNITEDPLFRTDSPSYRLRPDSPCIDAGDGLSAALSQTDVDGQPRVQGGRVDIGAAEWAAPAGLARVFVRPDGDDTKDGATWETAKRTVRAALRGVRSPGGEVWVASGTYTGTVTVPPGVGLYGGFTGAEAERENRNPDANITVLDGNARGSAVRIGPGDGTDTVVSGFTIRRGIGALAVNKRFGGGVFVDRAAPTLTHNRITMNTAEGGGGLYLLDSPAIIEDSVIERNTVRLNGAGLFLDRSSARIRGNVIRLNEGAAGWSGYGGGICVSRSEPSITNNRFEANRNGRGSGLSLQFATSRLAGNLFLNNVGEAIQSEYSTLEMHNNTLVGNSVAFTGSAQGAATNNIVAFNTIGFRGESFDPVGLAMRENLVYGNAQANFQNTPDPTGKDGNISMDPLFVDRAGGNVRLLPGSPAMDTGDDTALPADTTDLDGGTRPQGPHIDMGAYEAPVSHAYTTGDVIAALRMAAGLSPASAAAAQRFNVTTEGSSAAVLDMADASRLARKAAGLDANPREPPAGR